MRLRIADPKLFVLASQDAFNALYQYVQLSLREMVGAATLEDLLARRNEIVNLAGTPAGVSPATPNAEPG